MSGSLTISMSGTPARLKSTPLRWSDPGNPSWTSFPASSSIWIRLIPTVRSTAAEPGPASSRMRTAPSSASGNSYWVIW